MPPRPKPRSLDDLLAHARHYAETSMRKFGRLPPTLFLIGADGPQMYLPDALPDEAAKDDFATTARLMCVAHAATACVMALEAWAKFAKPGEALDPAEPPSEAFDRAEVVVLMGEDRAGCRQRLLPIVRSANGNFFGFDEPDALNLDGMQGRFAQLLPPRVPAEKDRSLAKAVLQVRLLGRAATLDASRHWSPGSTTRKSLR